jgi:hypothetical protein
MYTISWQEIIAVFLLSPQMFFCRIGVGVHTTSTDIFILRATRYEVRYG